MGRFVPLPCFACPPGSGIHILTKQLKKETFVRFVSHHHKHTKHQKTAGKSKGKGEEFISLWDDTTSILTSWETMLLWAAGEAYPPSPPLPLSQERVPEDKNRGKRKWPSHVIMKTIQPFILKALSHWFQALQHNVFKILEWVKSRYDTCSCISCRNPQGMFTQCNIQAYSDSYLVRIHVKNPCIWHVLLFSMGLCAVVLYQ